MASPVLAIAQVLEPVGVIFLFLLWQPFFVAIIIPLRCGSNASHGPSMPSSQSPSFYVIRYDIYYHLLYYTLLSDLPFFVFYFLFLETN